MLDIGKPVLGYVVCLTMSDGAFFGGVLITDSLGLPIEFRHTEPLAPTRLQRILYGRSLDTYMYNDVVLGALLSAVENKPQMYIAGDAAYLMGACGFGPSAIWLSEARNVPLKEIGQRHDIAEEEYVLQLGPGNGPVRVRLHVRPEVDTLETLRDASTRLLGEASQSMELIEPLQRVESALKLLWEEQQQVSRLAA